MKKSISCCLSHQNPPTYLFRAALACEQCLICADFSWFRLNDFMDYVILWIEDSYFGQKQQFKVKNVLMILLLTNTQLFSSHDINWWTLILTSVSGPIDSIDKKILWMSMGPKTVWLPTFFKYLILCYREERNSYRFGTTWGWVNDDTI